MLDSAVAAEFRRGLERLVAGTALELGGVRVLAEVVPRVQVVGRVGFAANTAPEMRKELLRTLFK